METPNENNGCLFPFGNNFLMLFALLLLDDEEREMRKVNSEKKEYNSEELYMDEVMEFDLDDDSERCL